MARRAGTKIGASALREDISAILLGEGGEVRGTDGVGCWRKLWAARSSSSMSWLGLCVYLGSVGLSGLYAGAERAYKKLMDPFDLLAKFGTCKEGAGAYMYDRDRSVGSAEEETGRYCFGQ